MQIKSFRDFIARIFIALKRSALIMLCIIAAFAAFGVIYANSKQQTWTATERAIFKATTTEGQEKPYDYTASKIYLDTVKGFFKSGNVLARADAYYEDYINNKDKFATVKDYSTALYNTYEKSYSYDEFCENQSDFIGKEIYFDIILHNGTGKDYEYTTNNRKITGIFKGIEREDETRLGNVVDAGVLQVDCIVLQHVAVDSEIRIRGLNYYYKPTGSVTAEKKTYKEIEKLYPNKYKDTEGYAYATNFTFRESAVAVSTEAKHFSAGNIGISSSSDSLALNISYTDVDATTAKEKSQILILALDVESRTVTPKSVSVDGINDDTYFNNVESFFAEFKYFGVKVSLTDWGELGATANLNRNSYIKKYLILGVVCAIVAAFAVALFDRTVKSKEELEEIIGVNCFVIKDTRGVMTYYGR